MWDVTSRKKNRTNSPVTSGVLYCRKSGLISRNAFHARCTLAGRITIETKGVNISCNASPCVLSLTVVFLTGICQSQGTMEE